MISIVWRFLSSPHGRSIGIWVIVVLEVVLLFMHITGIGDN